jgi:membrane-bound lytic murein transglycosylase D
LRYASRTAFFFFALCVLSSFASPLQAEELFPEPPSLHPAVAFWTRVYTEVDTDSGLLHDDRHLGIVYETLHFDTDNRRVRQRLINRRKHHWRAALLRLGHGGAPRDGRERAVAESLAAALGRAPTAGDYRHAAQRLRFQLGQRDKFRLALIRAGAYEDRMHAMFRDMGLPPDLAHLPYVESSFHPRAYSKYGAAGIWQFIRSTGRLYLNIGYVVDERLDPMRATRAAAELLRRNYERLGTWPLAITAYNHGAAGMERAQRVLGTDDIGVIVQKYRSRTFGFASRNFYAQFLAACDVVHNYRAYFGDLDRDSPKDVDKVQLPFYVDVKDIERYLGVDTDVLARYNPSLRPPVFDSYKRIPAGYTLRLPAGTVAGDADTWLAGLPDAHRYDKQVVSRFHTVRRGETLSQIAKIHRTRVSTIVALNNLRSSRWIYPGQVLELLASDADRQRAASAEPRKPPPGGLYTVRRGDTLSGIARRYGLTTRDLAVLNDLRSRNRIYPDQKLAVAEPEQAQSRQVAASDSGPAQPEAADGAGAEAGAFAAYEVVHGDTLVGIAESHDTTVRQLVALNDGLDDVIRPGQVLRLPAGESLEAGSAAGGVQQASLDESPGDDDSAAGGMQEASVDERPQDGSAAGSVQDASLDERPGDDDSAAGGMQEASLDEGLQDRSAAGDREITPPAVETAPVAMLPNGETPATSLPVPAWSGNSRWRRIDGDWIVVDAEETLGHYADWLKIPTQRLRNLNGLRFGRPVRIGQRLRLDFSRVSRKAFFERRLAYHKAIEEDFLGSYRITGLLDHTLRRGESLWTLAYQLYEVPPWLLYRFNPNTDLRRLRPGERLTIPIVEPQTSS